MLVHVHGAVERGVESREAIGHENLQEPRSVLFEVTCESAALIIWDRENHQSTPLFCNPFALDDEHRLYWSTGFCGS